MARIATHQPAEDALHAATVRFRKHIRQRQLHLVPFEPDVTGECFVGPFAGQGDGVAGFTIGFREQDHAGAGRIEHGPLGGANQARKRTGNIVLGDRYDLKRRAEHGCRGFGEVAFVRRPRAVEADRQGGQRLTAFLSAQSHHHARVDSAAQIAADGNFVGQPPTDCTAQQIFKLIDGLIWIGKTPFSAAVRKIEVPIGTCLDPAILDFRTVAWRQEIYALESSLPPRHREEIEEIVNRSDVGPDIQHSRRQQRLDLGRE